MGFKVFGLLLIGFVGIISCQGEELNERDKAIGMLKDLAKFFQDDPIKSYQIEEVLKASEVSKETCPTSLLFYPQYDEFTGRARQLLMDSYQLQVKLCGELWANSIMESASRVNRQDLESIRSMTESMIAANGGYDFEGFSQSMPYKNAQEGVLRFMESKSGEKFSKYTREKKFNKIFEEHVRGPCSRYISSMQSASKAADDYLYFLMQPNQLRTNSDPNVLELAKFDLICDYITASGYSSRPKASFQEDIFQNLSNKK